MGKYIVGSIVVVIVLLGAWYFSGTDEATYVAEIDGEVQALETELAAIEAQVAAGTLTPEEAVAARSRIEMRLDAINASVSTAQRARLNESQRQQLLAALDRLRGTLEGYRATLTVVEETAATRSPRSSSGSRRTLIEQLTEALDELEEQVEELVEEYEEADENDDSGDDESEDTTDEEVNDDTATSTEEEMNDDTATSSDSGMDSETEATTAVDADGTIEVSTSDEEEAR